MSDKTYKVLMINTVPTDKNGITNVIFNLIRVMDKSDMQIDLVSPNPPDKMYEEEIRSYGGEIYTIPRSIRHPFRYKKQLRKLIEKNRYDIVHAHGNSHTLALEMSAAKKAGCSVRIAHAHNTHCRYGFMHKLLAGTFYRNYTCGLACGDDAGRFLFDKHPFTVLYNGIDVKKFAFDEGKRNDVRTQYGLQDKKVIGHVGIFNAQKNQEYLLSVLQSLSQNEDGYRIMSVGDGELRQDFCDKAAEMGLADRTITVGTTSHVNDYLSAFDVLAMPSLFEGLPLSLIEAQANGLTCVVSDRIAREADKTGNLIFLPLDADTTAWGHAIKDGCCVFDRKQASEKAISDIRAAQYDIQESAVRLKSIYANEVNARYED